MKHITIGILAHVDAGKTTLSECMLYLSGQIRKLGRWIIRMHFWIHTNWSGKEESRSFQTGRIKDG